jgi:hypothetical protein
LDLICCTEKQYKFWSEGLSYLISLISENKKKSILDFVEDDPVPQKIDKDLLFREFLNTSGG